LPVGEWGRWGSEMGGTTGGGCRRGDQKGREKKGGREILKKKNVLLNELG